MQMRISSQHQVDPGFSEFDQGPATANGELRDTGAGNCPWRVVHGDDVHSPDPEDCGRIRPSGDELVLACVQDARGRDGAGRGIFLYLPDDPDPLGRLPGIS